MSITDELRNYANHRIDVTRDPLLAIADRIDAEHVAALKSLGMAQAERDEYLESCHLWEFKCESMVELPRDADGEPIHVGDEMECVTPLHPDVPKAFKVQRISLESSGWMLVAYPASYKPENCRHVKKPTVEDVLRDFAEQYAFYSAIEGDIHPDLNAQEEVLRQFAAKLRLADE